MGLDFSKPCGNGYRAEGDPGLTGGNSPSGTANCGTCCDRCCDVFCQVCVGVCCSPCSGDCSYTFCHLCLGITQDLVKAITVKTPPSDAEGYDGCKKPWLKIPQADTQEVIDAQAKRAMRCHGCWRGAAESDRKHKDCSGREDHQRTRHARSSSERRAWRRGGCQGVGGGDKRRRPADRRHDRSDSCWKRGGAWTGDCLISLEGGPPPPRSRRGGAYAFAQHVPIGALCMRA